MLGSQAPFFDRLSYLTIRQWRIVLCALGNAASQITKAVERATNVFEVTTSLRDDTRDGLVMTGNHDFLAASDAIQEFAEPGLGFEGGDGGHKLTSR
jgi:hypothetical protein